MTSYRDAARKLAAHRREIAKLRKKIRQVQASAKPETVDDYEFTTARGSVRLCDLFADKDDLIVIHNMGTSCPACTMWADGFNGIYHHLADRAAFVVSSPDPPGVQKRFAARRGWRFPMVSHKGTTFADDMGYRSKSEGWMPGISVFRRDAEGIVRVSDAPFDAGDDFCSIWRIFDLLPGGAGEWSPKFRYA